jgi:hypothetical protein
MQLNLDKEEDRYLYVLEQLCKDVREGQACPTPEVLTSALKALFPKVPIPEGTGIAVHNSPNASWYVDVGTRPIPSWDPQVYDLRRRLTSYIVVRKK